VPWRVLWLFGISTYPLLYTKCQSTRIKLCLPKNALLMAVCIFYKVFASFWHLIRKNLHINKLYVNCVTCEEKKVNTSIHTLEIRMTCTTRHVTLRWPFRRKARFQLPFIFVFENITWHFEFEVECEMKFVKHTQWLLVHTSMPTP
jgi:hypothetical protein